MLNAYAQRFAQRLFAAYPEWRHLCREYGNNFGVTISSPQADGSALHIYTEEEISISFDRWHAHFGWGNDSEEQGFTDALEFIHDLLVEDVCVAVFMKGEQWAGAEAVAPETTPVLGPGVTLVYVRSWLGTYNKEYQAQG